MELSDGEYTVIVGQQQQRIKELEEEQTERADDHMKLVEENHRLREQLARAEAVLKLYADEDNWNRSNFEHPLELDDLWEGDSSCGWGIAQDYFKGK